MSDADLAHHVEDAINVHVAWKFRLQKAIASGNDDIAPEAIRCDDHCAFGQWLYGRTVDEEAKAGVPYQVVKRLHAEFHRAAGDVLEAALAGRTAQAVAMLDGDFTERSDKLVRALTKWKRELTAVRP